MFAARLAVLADDGSRGKRILAGIGQQGNQAGDESEKDELTKGFLFHSDFSYGNSMVAERGRDYPVKALGGKRNPVRALQAGFVSLRRWLTS
jgi:hypothetical protein